VKIFSPVFGQVLFMPLFISGLVACQEDKEPIKVGTEIPVESERLTSAPQEMPDPASRILVGEVISIEGENYVIQDVAGENFTITPTVDTFVDESLVVGDKADVRFSLEDQPIAIRKDSRDVIRN
jgi:hypothetical protein